MAPTLAPGDRILQPVNLVHHRALGLHVVWKRCVVRVEIPLGHAESPRGRTSMELNDDLDEACDEAMREACPAANTGLALRRHRLVPVEQLGGDRPWNLEPA